MAGIKLTPAKRNRVADFYSMRVGINLCFSCLSPLICVRNKTVKPFLIRGPQNQTAVVGSSVTFQCRVGGEPGEYLILTFTLIVRSFVLYIQRYTFVPIPVPDVLWRRSASGGNMPLREYIAYTHFGWVYPKTHLRFVQHTKQ